MNTEQRKKFQEYKKNPYGFGIEDIDEKSLVLRGGGDFRGSDYDEPDWETRQRAEEIARSIGYVITNSRGEWWGYSSYTPDPGDVSIFYWTEE